MPDCKGLSATLVEKPPNRLFKPGPKTLLEVGMTPSPRVRVAEGRWDDEEPGPGRSPDLVTRCRND